MPTLDRSTELLVNAKNLDGLAAIARELGFSEPLSLDARALSKLGLPAAIEAARIARGAGDLRALLLELRPECNSRDTLTAIATALSRRAPQLLWIVLATSGADVAIICWSVAARQPRIASLACSRDKVFTSDAETLSSLAAAVSESPLLTCARWLDILGRESITRKFFRQLQTTVDLMSDSITGNATPWDRSELALVYLSRLIFLSFLEAKGWLDGDFGFLANGYSRCMAASGRYQKRVLEPLFFGTLNTRARSRAVRAREFGRIPFLNGGLFARSPLEKRLRRCAFSDDAFGNAFGSLLSHYRFTGREDSAAWSEASIDPEILGKAFEALMASGDRKGSGAFYTPQELVEHVAEEALRGALSDSPDLDAIRALRVIDPACGSGAFLVHMLERLTRMRIELGEAGSVAEVRRRVLASSIFGVDLNPTAVWLCELRLWLSVVVETADTDPMRVPPLPNLDRHIRVGDSLTGGGFGNPRPEMGGTRLQALRGRYMRASGPRKRTLGATLDRQERQAALHGLSRSLVAMRANRQELLLQLRTRDLFGMRSHPLAADRARLVDLRCRMQAAASKIRILRSGGALPFSFEAHFADAAAAGGFHMVIGNPPWVRLHRIGSSSREWLRREFTVYREAAWRAGSEISGAGRGFAAQVDMATLFVERSHALAMDGGTIALLLPAKLWRSLAGGGLRALLGHKTEMLLLEDHSAAKAVFDAAVYPSLLVCRRNPSGARPLDREQDGVMRCEVRSAKSTSQWRLRSAELPFDETPGAPWLLVPRDVRRAFERIRKAGAPLASSEFGRPLLGVKTGCNEAFLVHVDSVDRDLAVIRANGRTATIERCLLRRAVRGENLPVANVRALDHIVWPHDPHGRPLETLPPLALRWLRYYKHQLSARSDLHNRKQWWSAFRVESACSDRARVIWADIGRRPRAMVAPVGEPLVPLNSCYAVHCPTLEDARALAAFLNGPLAAAWLDVIAEPARGGYRRFLGWTVALLPIPRDWEAVRPLLSQLGESGEQAGDADLLTASLKACRLTRAEIEPLLAWTGRSS